MDGKIVITADASQLRSEMQRAADEVRGFEGDAGQRLIANLQEQVKTFSMTSDQMLQYKAGMLGVGDEAQQLIARLQKMKDAQAGFSGAADENVNNMHRMGNSAAQTAFAMRMVPAQLSDITTQLMGGQNPLLIMVEQGGQMRDMFGGFGPMFRGLASMITPVVVGVGALAAGIGGLIFAYHEGEKESEKIQQSLRLTGNYAGITEGKFNEMAHSIAASAEAGVGDARAALQQLVSTGRFTSDSLQAVGQTALTFAHLSGQAAGKVVEDFAGMADGVTKWVEKHNEQYHFLTGAQYEHIAALEREGQTQEAMQAAMDAFNAHLHTQAENVGYLESAWRKAKQAMSAFWDDMKSIGRDETIDDKIKAATSQLASLEARARAARGTREGAALQGDIAGVRGNLEQLQARKDLQEVDAKSAKLADELHEKAIRAAKDNEELAKSLRSRAQQGDDEVKKYMANQQAMLADGMAGDSPEKQATTIAAIRKKYAEKPHGNTQMRQWEAELEEIKLKEQEKAQAEGRFYESSKQEEQKYWQQKLALTTAGSKENAAVRKKVAELGISVMKEQFDAEQAGLKLGIEASKDAYQARLIYMQKYVDNAREKYGQDSAQYLAALKEQETMRREHESQMRQIDQIRLADARSNEAEILSEKQRVAQMDYDLGLITRAQLLEIDRGYILEKQRLELDAANDEIKRYKTDTVEYEKALAKKKAIERRYNGQLSQNSNAQTVEQHKPQTGIIGSAQSSIDQNFASMLTRAQSFQQAMAGISKSVGLTMVQEMVTKPFAQWAAGWLRKLAMNLGFLGTETAQHAAAAATGASITAASGTAQIATNAAVAGSGAAASQAPIPFVGPILAIAAMAAIFAAVSGMSKGVKSASQGFDIPRGMNPMTQLHEEEMVIPARYANGLRNIINSGGTPSGGAPNITYNDHSGRLSPTDIRRNAKVIADALRDHAKKQ